MAGPLPSPRRRRTNAPTIPSTDLPAGGRPGAAPKVPAWVRLGEAGAAWWKWAWKTPQAAAWSKGDLVMIARRAQLEDMLAVRALGSSAELGRLLDLVDDSPDDLADAARLVVESVVDALSASATGAVTIMRECRELDDRLGLTPKGMAALRWRIVPTAPPAAKAALVADLEAADEKIADLGDWREERRARLSSGGA